MNSQRFRVPLVAAAVIQFATCFLLSDRCLHADPPPLTREWARQLGTNEQDRARDVASDFWGNVYIVGDTRGALERHTNQGHSDAFIVSYDAKGHLRWQHHWGTELNDYAYRVVTDRQGNVFVISSFYGSERRGSSLIAFSRTGTKLWERPLNVTPQDYVIGVALCVDRCGRIVVAGSTSATHDRYFITSFDRLGNRQGFQTHGQTTRLEPWAIAVDSSGNTFVAGTIGNAHPSLEKHDAAGNLVWSRDLSWIGRAHALVVDRCGRPTMVGWAFRFEATREQITRFSHWIDALRTGEEPPEMPADTRTTVFVAKYSSSGELLAKHRWDDIAGEHSGLDAAADYFGTIYITGAAGNAPGEIFVAKANDSARPDWVRYVEGPDPRGIALGIDVDLCWQLHISGSTRGRVSDTPHAGKDDAFVIRFRRNDYPLSPSH